MENVIPQPENLNRPTPGLHAGCNSTVLWALLMQLHPPHKTQFKYDVTMPWREQFGPNQMQAGALCSAPGHKLYGPAGPGLPVHDGP